MNKIANPKSASLLRILQFPLARLFLVGGPLFVMMAVSNGFIQKFSSTPLAAIATAIAMAAFALVIYALLVRLIERRPVSELSLSGMSRELGLGLLTGAALYTVSVLILMALGIYRIEGLNPWHFVLPAIAMTVTSGVFEELVFRGALFRIIEEWLGSWISLVVSSAVFGFSHLMNPSATVMSAIFISIEAGLLLAAAYMLTRRLWLSIGLHMGWNYTQSAIFSGVVSGNAGNPGLIRPTIEGPVLLTGGTFGLEASLIAFIVCTAAGIALLVMAVRRGNVVAPIWKRSH